MLNLILALLYFKIQLTQMYVDNHLFALSIGIYSRSSVIVRVNFTELQILVSPPLFLLSSALKSYCLRLGLRTHTCIDIYVIQLLSYYLTLLRLYFLLYLINNLTYRAIAINCAILIVCKYTFNFH